MVAAAFEYLSVASYDEAVERLVEHGEDAKVIAGGQSLVPMMNLRLVRPSVLVDLNPIGARPPASDGTTLSLAGLTRHKTLLEDATVRRDCPLLSEAIRHVGNVRVRARGTIGGSLAHADPTSEIGATALVLDAQLLVQGPGGSRTLAARELFVSYLTTTLEPAEIVTDILLPVTRPREGCGFQEMVRRSSDLAIVAVTARAELEPDADVVRSVDLAIAGVGDRVQLVGQSLLAELVGTAGDDAVRQRVARAVAGSVNPDSDVHASGEYRRRLVEVLTARAFRDAVARAAQAA